MQSRGKGTCGPTHIAVTETTLSVAVVVDEERSLGASKVFEEIEERIARHGRIV